MIIAGARWKVGLGTDIKIVGLSWLPYITSDNMAFGDNTVSSLMGSFTRTWDEDISTNLFNERDQRYIRRIFLSEIQTADCLYWSKDSTWLYSVRSAYRLLPVQKNLWQRHDSGSIWNKLWRIKAPPKVINCLW